MSIRAFVVSAAEIFAQQTCSLNPLDYDNDAKRAELERDAKKLRERAATLTVRADGLEAQARTLPPQPHVPQVRFTMTRKEAAEFLRQVQLTVVTRCGSNYDDERYLRVNTAPESSWDSEGKVGGANDTKTKFEEAVRVLTGDS